MFSFRCRKAPYDFVVAPSHMEGMSHIEVLQRQDWKKIGTRLRFQHLIDQAPMKINCPIRGGGFSVSVCYTIVQLYWREVNG